LESLVVLIALIAFAIWIAVSVFAGLLFGRVATLNEQSDPSHRRSPARGPRAIPMLRIAGDRTA
jgi:hypothetical protein